jgi:hypothetical protein
MPTFSYPKKARGVSPSIGQELLSHARKSATDTARQQSVTLLRLCGIMPTPSREAERQISVAGFRSEVTFRWWRRAAVLYKYISFKNQDKTCTEKGNRGWSDVYSETGACVPLPSILHRPLALPDPSARPSVSQKVSMNIYPGRLLRHGCMPVPSFFVAHTSSLLPPPLP